MALTTKSKRILEKGKSIWIDWYQYPNGNRWVACYKGRYYYIDDDGTGNGFFTRGDAQEISENDAIRICAKYGVLDKACKVFGWVLSDDDIDKALGL